MYFVDLSSRFRSFAVKVHTYVISRHRVSAIASALRLAALRLVTVAHLSHGFALVLVSSVQRGTFATYVDAVGGLLGSFAVVTTVRLDPDFVFPDSTI